MFPPTREESNCLKNIQQALWLLKFHQSSEPYQNISPKYSLPFFPSESELRKKFLLTALPWLETAPNMDSSAAFGNAIHILTGHGDYVRCCSYSPDGRLIATGGDDGVVRLWDAETATVQHAFNCSGYVYSVLFTSSKLLVAVWSNSMQIWDASTGTKLPSPQTEKKMGSFWDIHSSPNGRKLAATQGSTVVIWEIPPNPETDNWTEPLRVQGEAEREDIRAVRFSPDGKLMAYSQSTKIFLWEVESGNTIRCFEGHKEDIYSLVFREDSKLLASGSDDTTLRVWETYAETVEPVCVLKTHGIYVQSVSFSSDGSRLAAGSTNTNHITIWKLSTIESNKGSDTTPLYEFEKELRGHSDGILMLSFAPDGQQMISSSMDATARIWDVDGQQEVGDVQAEAEEPAKPKKLEGHSTPISFIAFSQKDDIFASASSDGKICLWSCVKGDLLGSLEEHDLDIMWLAFSHDGSILVSTSKDRVVCVWDTCQRVLKHRLFGHTDWVRCVAMSPNGQLIASSSDDSSVRVWDISNVPPKDITKHSKFYGDDAHHDYVYAVIFSPSGRYLASSGDDLQILIWNLNHEGDQKEPEIALKSTSEWSIRSLAFTDDETRIISGDFGGTIQIWNLAKRSCERVFETGRQLGLFHTIRFEKGPPSVLITETGAWPIAINGTLSTVTSIPDEPSELPLICETLPHTWTYGISKNREWITWNKKNLMFLPLQYRPRLDANVTCCVQSRKVAIGCESGQILFFKFSETINPELAE